VLVVSNELAERGEAGWWWLPSLFHNGVGRWNSPYINHFTQPDTIVPDQTSPQSWDRYAYVFNNPVRYNDPDGHCPVCALPLVVLDLALVAAVATATYVMLNPDVHDAAVESITNAIDSVSEFKGKQGYQQNKNQLNSLETSSHTSGDNNLGPGYGYKPPKCGWKCWLTIGGAGSYILYKLYCSADDEACKTSVKTTPEPTQTSTSTSTSILSSTTTHTMTSTATMAPTSTPSPTSTSTFTPTLAPGPSSIPIQYWHHHNMDW
jgi:RHS repeat-associated protein